MLRFTKPNAKRNRHVAGIKVSDISDTRMLVLNLEAGFCCFRSIHTLTSARRRTNPRIKRARKIKVEGVYSRTICVGSDGLKNGMRVKATWTNTIKDSISRKTPAK